MDPLIPIVDDSLGLITENPALDEVITVEDNSDDNIIPPPPLVHGPIVHYPSAVFILSKSPLPIRGLSWFTGVIMVGMVGELMEIRNSCTIDGICTLFRLLARATGYDVTSLFKSITLEGIRVENTIRKMISIDSPLRIVPYPSGIPTIRDRDHDTAIKGLWCGELAG